MPESNVIVTKGFKFRMFAIESDTMLMKIFPKITERISQTFF